MPTSELSQALNPYFAQPRPRSSNTQNHSQPVVPSSQSNEPHNTGLQFAISDPSERSPAAPTSPLQNPAVRPANSSSGVHPFQIVMHYLNSTREAQEIEQRRRLAWEQEQEAKYALRQAEMDRRMLEMQQELAALKAKLAFGTPKVASASSSGQRHSMTPHAPEQQQPTPGTSPALSHSSTNHASPDSVQSSVQRHPSAFSDGELPAASPVGDTPGSAYASSPILSPPARFINVDPSSSRRGNSSNSRKRPTLDITSDDGSDTSQSSIVERPLKRKNHHDTRCLTIQHAMRNHLLRVMQLEDDKQLPDGHVEGAVTGPGDPVRFVWDKTPKQSVHNARMKERVLCDLRANRHLYKHVPNKDFNKKSLESVFDQAFVTLRQKFRGQRDSDVAVNQKQREDVKAMRSRRLSRKKTKLSNRSDARNKIEAFEHIVFDGALQVECMSSEESEADEDSIVGSHTSLLRIRRLPWRSTRLQRFLDILDEEEKADNLQKPRRGVGRKERSRGPPKEGVLLPPKGVATWMISKRWVSEMQASHLEVLSSLKDIVVDPSGFEWSQFHSLGEESEDEGRLDMGQHMMVDHNTLHFTHPHNSTAMSVSSSLHNALLL
ncbi:hypothetical protein K503DRAFT_764929 [Rhizopogon vinicolor AM-OR11-026]|uniref:Uncharacterized protein n=1 Tax=Rhizopogon vinicolor AM-OR11-026 TaxID=1314800 RepID=A0A1B7NHY1_9AGAM|nr:hypothetical protein K503DRAFT_764929 [Rhizopogon vinicolor AM-OR11-026]